MRNGSWFEAVLVTCRDFTPENCGIAIAPPQSAILAISLSFDQAK